MCMDDASVCRKYGGAQEGQKRSSSPLKLELGKVAKHLKPVLGTELRSSGKAESYLNR